MVTYETLNQFLGKVRAALDETQTQIRHTTGLLAELRKQEAVQQGEIFAIEELMNIERNPPVVEMPMVDEEQMKEQHDKRLDFFPGQDPEEFFANRQEGTYKREANETVDLANEFNSQEV
jgi:hypothetical protein